MRIDSHHHVWRQRDWPQTWIPDAHRDVIGGDFWFDDWQAAAGRCGVAGAVVVQTVPDSAETPYLLARASSVHAVLGVVGWLDPVRSPDEQLAALLDAAGAHKLVGIRLQAEYEPDVDWLASASAARIARAAGARGLAIDLLVHPGNLSAARVLVRGVPGARFVVDHLAKPDLGEAPEHGGWSAAMARLAELDNVAVKVSGLHSLAAFTADDASRHVEALVLSFGAERLMFGSDWPVSLVGATYSEVVADVEEWTTAWSVSERASLWSESARVWYDLNDRERGA